MSPGSDNKRTVGLIAGRQFASSVPTAGGVYHWATLAGGKKWGRIVGFFTGWINFYGVSLRRLAGASIGWALTFTAVDV